MNALFIRAIAFAQHLGQPFIHSVPEIFSRVVWVDFALQMYVSCAHRERVHMDIQIVQLACTFQCRICEHRSQTFTL